MQVVELFEHKYATDESHRTQKAAKCLVWVLTKHGKDVDPHYVTLANEKNPLVVDPMVERELRKQMKALLAEGQAKFDQLLLDPSAEGKLLRDWWRVDHHGTRDYSVDPLLLVRKLTPEAVNGMIPLYHIAGKYTKSIIEREGGDRISRADPDSKTHELMVRLDALEVRTHTDAGGEVTFLVYATKYHDNKGVHTSTTYDIIRTDGDRLVTGDPKKAGHLPGWQRPTPIPDGKAKS